VISSSCTAASAQDQTGRVGYAISASFAPDSSHILIGRAEQRQVWTLGIEADRTVYSSKSIRIDYFLSISPFFQERDPTIIGTYGTLPDGSVYRFPAAPVRVVTVNGAPLGYLSTGSGAPIPLYPIERSTEKTYAVAVSPIGARLNVLSFGRLQTTFAIDLGTVLSSNSLPVDNASRFNYMFSFGPGFEFFTSRNAAIRLEYLYRHISNANAGLNNPGIDSGVIRLSVTKRH
jgi:hypothetical protein